ncbi:MAG: 1-deoxy-D-xylulose-5-phosphate synthase [Coriobacteriales bacterium]|nr:1-deoxy-D-xylulose-5-phosphate synthase [Coriobacteriales bacterium]
MTGGEGILQGIERPCDLRSLTNPELRQLAAEIRARLVEVTSVTGGHLASSLGTVEILLALHRLYDFSVDRLVFDVGHQAYAHKLVTGRNGQFDTLRTFAGVCGFPRRDESRYDTHESGHASDSLSIACGLAAARDLKGSDERIAVLVGDAALSGGMAFEALNQIGHCKTDITIVLNDNEMSISRNVGALSLYLVKVRMSRPYTRTRDTVEGGLRRIGRAGAALVNAGERAKSSAKTLFVPGMFFEDMGIKYIGPINGHNIGMLHEALKTAMEYHGPILIHALTQKGRGYGPAERHPDLYHGVGPFDPKSGELKAAGGNGLTFTAAFSEALVDEASHNTDIVAITAAMEDGTGLNAFKQEYPERFFDVGIAEEHAVALSAGLALGGKLPVVAIYSTFLQRAFDQLVINVALQKQHVVFCIDRAGLVGEDGPTHHGVFDLVYLRAIPGMRVIAPADADEFKAALHTALKMTDGPVALRYPRGTAPKPLQELCTEDAAGNEDASVPEEDSLLLPVGKAKLVRRGGDVCILALGRFVPVAVEAAGLLAAGGIEACVYNMLWVKPLDEAAVRHAAQTRLIVTLEDGVVHGGFGSAVLEALARHSVAEAGAAVPVPNVLNLGIPDQFVTHGAVSRLFEELGLTPRDIAAAIQVAINGQEPS